MITTSHGQATTLQPRGGEEFIYRQRRVASETTEAEQHGFGCREAAGGLSQDTGCDVGSHEGLTVLSWIPCRIWSSRASRPTPDAGALWFCSTFFSWVPPLICSSSADFPPGLGE